jgi:hypothetical protein
MVLISNSTVPAIEKISSSNYGCSYVKTVGVGDQKVPFHLDAHRKLLTSNSIQDDKVIALIKEVKSVASVWDLSLKLALEPK